MHRFRDMTTYLSKIAKKTKPPSFSTFLWGDPLRIFRWIILRQKLEWWGYQTVYISRSCFRCARHNTGVWQTDRQTNRHVAVTKTRASILHSVARVKMCSGGSLDVMKYTVSQKSCANLFLSELRQLTTDFNNFWQIYGKRSEILCGLFTSTSPELCCNTTL